VITEKTQRGIIILIVIASASFWLSRSQEDETPNPVSDVDPNLDYVLRDFELQFFDENGNPTLNLQAPLFRNNPDLELGTIENPVMVFHQPDVSWNFTAETATITADKEHVVLSGHVNLQRRELVSGNWVEINTSEVRVEVTPQTATTDQAVNFFDGRNHIDAIGMDLDIINDNLKLKEQVRATYAVD